jgi:hypothetical protein
MVLLNFADIFVQFTIQLGSVRLESGVMGSQEKFHPPIILDYLKKVIGAEQDLHPFVSVLAISFDDHRSYLCHELLLQKSAVTTCAKHSICQSDSPYMNIILVDDTRDRHALYLPGFASWNIMFIERFEHLSTPTIVRTKKGSYFRSF